MYAKNHSTRNCEINYAFMKSLTDNSVVTCDGVINTVAKSYKNMPETMPETEIYVAYKTV